MKAPHISNYLNPLHIIALRFGISVLILTIYFSLFQTREKLKFIPSKKIGLIGGLNALGYLTATIGQELLTAGIATLISTSFVVLVPIFAWKIEKKSLSSKKMLLTFVTLLGIFFIGFNGDWENFVNVNSLGVILLLSAATFWGLSIVYTSIESQKFNPIYFLFQLILSTFLPLSILVVLFDPLSHIPTIMIPSILFLVIFSTILTNILYIHAISEIGSVNTSFFLVLQVIIPIAFEFLVLQYYYTNWVYLGIGLILLAMLWISKQGQVSLNTEYEVSC
jgi:drug/metabolite transporter (DMT)-like permease